jgi:GNAT superfamily N-acetyltransferase
MYRETLEGMAPKIDVTLLDADGLALVERLTGLINRVYTVAEAGLWRDGATRTTMSQIARLVAARQIAVATVDGDLAGAIRVQALSERTGEFGMLAADPERRGIGIGRELVAFAERLSRARGHEAIQLELLVPRTWRHPTKVFLDDWYRRIGYHVVRTSTVEDAEPELAPLLATPCEMRIYVKPLA